MDCGPRAYLRPGTHMLNGSKAGTHVEIKKSTDWPRAARSRTSPTSATRPWAAASTWAPGSITCNYDGVHKHKTYIGNDVFVGSDTMIVAPGEIGDGALVAAGSVVTEPVPGRRAVRGPRAPEEHRGLGAQALRGAPRTEISNQSPRARTRGDLHEVP